MRIASTLMMATALFVASACGSSGSSSGPSSCTPGQSIACVGVGGCSGGQVCQADGTYGACDCGTGGDTGVDARQDSAVDTSSPDSSTIDTATDTAGETTVDADATTDTPPTPLSPDKLSGLSVWYTADTVSTFSDGTVQIWTDQSTNANNAHCRCAGGGGCSAGTAGPLVMKSAIKGHDAVVIGGTASGYCNVPDDPTIQFGTGPFAIIAVFAAQSAGDPTYLLRKDSTSGFPNEFNVIIDSNVNVYTPTADAHAFLTAAVFHAVIVRGPGLQVRIDGSTTTGTTSTTDISYPASQIMIGLQASGSTGPREIDLAEYVLVKGALSDSDVAGVELYLKNKYKFTF